MKVGVLAMMFACLLVVGFPLASTAGPLPDMDSDTILDVDDNCKLVPQTVGTNDCDTDSDGYGNMCDCDYTQDNLCGAPDFNRFKPTFGGIPGPSGLACAGTVTCP